MPNLLCFKLNQYTSNQSACQELFFKKRHVRPAQSPAHVWRIGFFLLALLLGDGQLDDAAGTQTLGAEV